MIVLDINNQTTNAAFVLIFYNIGQVYIERFQYGTIILYKNDCLRNYRPDPNSICSNSRMYGITIRGYKI